jgi:UV DNA damage repair endonuclease
MYSVRELYETVHLSLLVFLLHLTIGIIHSIPVTLPEEEAFFMARETWQRHGVTQCTHYSESRRREAQVLIERMFEHHGIDMADLPNWPTFHKQYKEFTKIKEQAHADFILATPNTYNVMDLDVL